MAIFQSRNAQDWILRLSMEFFINFDLTDGSPGISQVSHNFVLNFHLFLTAFKHLGTLKLLLPLSDLTNAQTPSYLFTWVLVTHHRSKLFTANQNHCLTNDEHADQLLHLRKQILFHDLHNFLRSSLQTFEKLILIIFYHKSSIHNHFLWSLFRLFRQKPF